MGHALGKGIHTGAMLGRGGEGEVGRRGLSTGEELHYLLPCRNLYTAEKSFRPMPCWDMAV